MPGGWLVKVELAGVRPEELEILTQGRTLTIRGCRRDWIAQESHSHYMLEIAYSSFARSLELPLDLSRARMTTEYREGMLLIRLELENNP
jgi:HSP20 family protein